MKYLLLLSLILFIIIYGCKKHDDEKVTESCSCDNPTNQLTVAKSSIIGDWTLVETIYSGRGSKPYSETPDNSNKQMIYKFSNDTLVILCNNLIINKEKYSVGFLRDFTNNQNDTTLVIKYSNQSNLSFLQIDTKCMRLVNSYNDAGVDLILKKN